MRSRQWPGAVVTIVVAWQWGTAGLLITCALAGLGLIAAIVGANRVE